MESLVHHLSEVLHLHGQGQGPDEAAGPGIETSEQGIRAVQLSLIGLGLTSIVQLVVALASGSVGLLADTIHNGADALTAFPLWIAFVVGRRAANRRYTYGFGRAEDLAGIIVVLLIAGSAAVAGWESLRRLANPPEINGLGWVMAAGALGFLGNEAVAWYRIRVGKRIGSAALVADGHHARTDGLSSLGVVFGALGVALGFRLADPIVGIAITVLILFVLRDAAMEIYHRLMDAVDPELVDSSERALRNAEGVEDVRSIRIRWVGHQLWAEADVVADCRRNLQEAHDIAERCRHELFHAVPRLARVTVHVDPCEHAGRDHHEEVSHHDDSLNLVGAHRDHKH